MNIQASVVALLIGGAIVASMTYVVKSQINARIDAEVIATAQKTRADMAEAQLDRLEIQLAEERERQEKLAQELQGARDLEAETTQVLENRARLGRLTQEKPGLIERHARRATARTWEEIEKDSRE